MRDDHKLRGIVLLRDDPDMMAMSSLLFASAKRYAHPEYHNQPSDIPLNAPIDFVLTHDLRALDDIAAHYQRAGAHLPAVVLLAHPDIIENTDFAAAYPTMPVLPVPQANLDTLDVTLNFELFLKVLKQLIEKRPN
ncbi:MAG: hypothetical protein ACLFTK_17615 [Anaerolineales bacterium]